MKALIIINPNSGRRRTRDYPKRICRALRFQGYSYDMVITQSAEEAELIAKTRAENFDLLVCLGGDGTLSSIINGLYGLEHIPPISYIPAGTRNDFAQSLGLSSDIDSFSRNLVSGRKQKLDIGIMNGRCFVYVAAFGLMAECSYATPAALKKRLGKFAYVIEGTREIPFTKAARLSVYSGEKKLCEGNYIFGAVSNSISIGGTLHYKSSDVDFCDGLHEVILVKKPKNPAMLAGILNALRKKDYSAEGIELFHLSDVRFEGEVQWSLDGEKFPLCKSIEIKNIPAALDFIVPRKVD